MSKTAQKYQSYYEKGFYTAAMLANLMAKGKITQEEYDEIVGTEEE